MPKRKRGERFAVTEDEHWHKAETKRVELKFRKAMTKLEHAFKVAKGFERQKLGRRRSRVITETAEQDIRTKTDDEINALKTLKTTICAQSTLSKSLLKIKSVSESEKLPQLVRLPVKVANDSAGLNVHARLCNSKVVKDALSAAITDIKRTLGIIEDEDIQWKNSVPSGHREAAPPTKKHKQSTRSEAFPPVSAHERLNYDAQNSLHANDRRSLQSEDDYLGKYNGHLASLEHENDAHDIAGLAHQLESEGTLRRREKVITQSYDRNVDLALSGDDTDAASLSPEPSKTPVPKTSAFLPSLTTVGYISGSGSDIDDAVDLAPKKNRPGQRARQQIWEKKYGPKAKHLQKQARDQGWDVKRGATDGSRPLWNAKRATSFDRVPNIRARRDEKKSAVSSESRARDDVGLLHPSWEAARKAKEKNEMAVGFQGRKITFE